MAYSRDLAVVPFQITSCSAKEKGTTFQTFFNTIIVLELGSDYCIGAGVWFCSHTRSTTEFINGKKMKSKDPEKYINDIKDTGIQSLQKRLVYTHR